MIKIVALIIHIAGPLLWGVGMFFLFEKLHQRRTYQAQLLRQNQKGVHRKQKCDE